MTVVISGGGAHPFPWVYVSRRKQARGEYRPSQIGHELDCLPSSPMGPQVVFIACSTLGSARDWRSQRRSGGGRLMLFVSVPADRLGVR